MTDQFSPDATIPGQDLNLYLESLLSEDIPKEEPIQSFQPQNDLDSYLSELLSEEESVPPLPPSGYPFPEEQVQVDPYEDTMAYLTRRTGVEGRSRDEYKREGERLRRAKVGEVWSNLRQTGQGTQLDDESLDDLAYKFLQYTAPGTGPMDEQTRDRMRTLQEDLKQVTQQDLIEALQRNARQFPEDETVKDLLRDMGSSLSIYERFKDAKELRATSGKSAGMKSNVFMNLVEDELKEIRDKKQRDVFREGVEDQFGPPEPVKKSDVNDLKKKIEKLLDPENTNEKKSLIEVGKQLRYMREQNPSSKMNDVLEYMFEQVYGVNLLPYLSLYNFLRTDSLS